MNTHLRRLMLALALCGTAWPALARHDGLAAAPRGFVDVYFIPSAEQEFTVDNDPEFGDAQVTLDGAGFGIKARAMIAPVFAFLGEYQGIEYDEASGDFDDFSFSGEEVDAEESQLRLGGAFVTGDVATIELGGNYVHVETEFEGLDNELSGFELHARGDFQIAPQFGLYGQAGYLLLEDDDESNSELDGFEFLIGGVFDITPVIGIFADYRSTQLEDEANDEVELSMLRTGVRINLP
jgi:hypothetical protein